MVMKLGSRQFLQQSSFADDILIFGFRSTQTHYFGNAISLRTQQTDQLIQDIKYFYLID